jgi:hypothetical protein
MSGAYRSGDEVRARYERDWYHAEILRLEPGGSYLVRRIKPKSGYVDHSQGERPESWWVEADDLRPMQKQGGNFSGF